jgi:hypothetical protein
MNFDFIAAHDETALRFFFALLPTPRFRDHPTALQNWECVANQQRFFASDDAKIFSPRGFPVADLMPLWAKKSFVGHAISKKFSLICCAVQNKFNLIQVICAQTPITIRSSISFL